VTETDGILLIDKPAGKTSHDIVAAVRREHRGRRVGHAGTLDPFATGLLLVLVGRATRIQRYLMALSKSYETIARLGATSTTGDTEGEIVETGLVPPDPPPLPTGELLQRPPAYSALKVDGRRAYDRARAGEDVVLDERPVSVYRFDQLWREGDRAAFAIECSAGTYVRTLISDLGDAYCLELRRTAIGPFSIDDASPTRLVSLAQALSFMPSLRLDGDDAHRAAHGVAVGAAGVADGDGDGAVLLVDSAGPIAVAEPRNGALKPVVGFRA
jgi:tRNA pseudouridine55 synthase